MIARLRASIRNYRCLPLSGRITLAVAWATLIWWASSRGPGSGEIGFWESLLHNAAHVGIYAVLAALIKLCSGERMQRATATAFVLTAVYGAGDEIHQMYVPGRYASLLDVVSDCLGAGLSLAALAWLATGQQRALRLVLLLIPLSLLSVLMATLY